MESAEDIEWLLSTGVTEKDAVSPSRFRQLRVRTRGKFRLARYAIKDKLYQWGGAIRARVTIRECRMCGADIATLKYRRHLRLDKQMAFIIGRTEVEAIIRDALKDMAGIPYDPSRRLRRTWNDPRGHHDGIRDEERPSRYVKTGLSEHAIEGQSLTAKEIWERENAEEN